VIRATTPHRAAAPDGRARERQDLRVRKREARKRERAGRGATPSCPLVSGPFGAQLRLPPRSPESARRLAPGRCRHGTALSWGRRSSCETLCADQQAPCWTFGCAALSRGRPDLPSPAPLSSGSRPLGVDPLQSLHVLPAGRPSRAGADSHEVLRPFDGIPRASPMCSGTSTVRCGSALRFSQPLSGFLASPGFAALFHAAAARGVLPSEPCSSPGSRAPLGVALLPCSSPPGVNPGARAWPFHSGFHRRPRLATRWPGSPPELGHRFHRACAYARIGFPGALTLLAHPGVATFRLRLLRSLDPPAKPYRPRSPKRPPAAVALLGFAPPEPSSDRASGPS
jgi:hypothetical protein